MKTLVIVGDSHSAGSEIENIEHNAYCYEKAWGRHLADKLGYDYINLSFPGASNWMITRFASDWVHDNIVKEKLYNPEDVTMVIMWSSFHRNEVIYPDSKSHRVYGPGTIIKGFYKTDHDDELEELQKLQILFDDPVQTQYYNLYHVSNLKTYLNKHNINHQFINGIQHFNVPEKMDKKNTFHSSFTTLFEQFHWDDDYIGSFNKSETYFFYFLDTVKAKFDPWVRSMHFNEQVHKQWADILYDRYKGRL